MFIIELPQDEYGNREYTNSQAAVIEVEEVDAYTWRVIAPETFCAKCPTLRSHRARWKEVEGPARLISEDEHKALLKG